LPKPCVRTSDILFIGLHQGGVKSRTGLPPPSARGEKAMDKRTLLGQRVKHLRRLRGQTQEQLAERIEINPKYLSSIERGVENPNLDLLIWMAKGLQMDLYELIQFEEGAPPAQLRRKMEALVAEVRAEELPRVVRLLEALMH
jgi:transcriptional regulator with XRE-family HTH domain